jgi:hypothetical protein
MNEKYHIGGNSILPLSCMPLLTLVSPFLYVGGVQTSCGLQPTCSIKLPCKMKFQAEKIIEDF